MPSASASRSSTSCAAASGAGANARPACCSTARRSAKPRKARIEILRETEDGFRIAEEDLRLRGEGDVLGTRQSGMPGFQRRADRECTGRCSSPRARMRSSFSRAIRTLTSPRGEALRHLLYLFERDEAIRLLRAG